MKSLQDKIPAVVAVVAAVMLGLVLSNLTMTETAPAEASPFDNVERVQPVQSGGAGFQPQSDQGCPCGDACLSESDVRSIVKDELGKRGVSSVATSKPATVTYSAPVVTYSQPTVTYSSSQPAVATQPVRTVVRRGLFGRRVYSTTSAPTSGTCRIVNGVRVCN